MKKTKLLLSATVLCSLFTLLGISAFASSSDKNKRQISKPKAIKSAFTNSRSPFDYSDGYYVHSGVNPDMIVSRRSGYDSYSVFDFIDDDRYRNVRVTATNAGYDENGFPILFNKFGELFESSFTHDTAGKDLLRAANRRAMYVFPSVQFPGDDRQAPLFESRYGADQNVLGVSVICHVEFTLENQTNEDYEWLLELTNKYGESLDGTPIITKTDTLMELLRRGLVSIRLRSTSEDSVPNYAIVPIMSDPTGGAIAFDAFLMTVRMKDGNPLPNETKFVDMFNCLQKYGTFCGAAPTDGVTVK